jgi:hypothetical protein
MKAKEKKSFPKALILFAFIGWAFFVWFMYDVTQGNIGWAIFDLFWSALAISQIPIEVELNGNKMESS